MSAAVELMPIVEPFAETPSYGPYASTYHIGEAREQLRPDTLEWWMRRAPLGAEHSVDEWVRLFLADQVGFAVWRVDAEQIVLVGERHDEGLFPVPEWLREARDYLPPVIRADRFHAFLRRWLREERATW